jgi:hypothetical protein
MRTVKNITVAVTPELYRQTRRLAVEFDTTVTALVTFLLVKMPTCLRDSRFPVGGPKPKPSTQPPLSGGNTLAPSVIPHQKQIEKSGSMPTESPMGSDEATHFQSLTSAGVQAELKIPAPRQ